MNIKRYKKKNTQFNVIWPEVGLRRELERALEINLIQRDLALLLMTQEYSLSP